jgi:hypothetical protein
MPQLNADDIAAKKDKNIFKDDLSWLNALGTWGIDILVISRPFLVCATSRPANPKFWLGLGVFWSILGVKEYFPRRGRCSLNTCLNLLTIIYASRR